MDGLSYNVGGLENLASDLNAQLNNFQTAIDEMYTSIDTNLNNADHWQGEAYTAFKKYCDDYKTAFIEPLISDITKWIAQINTAAEMASENTNRNVSNFE